MSTTGYWVDTWNVVLDHRFLELAFDWYLAPDYNTTSPLPIGGLWSSHRRNLILSSADSTLPIGGICSSHRRDWPKLEH